MRRMRATLTGLPAREMAPRGCDSESRPASQDLVGETG